MDNRSFNINFEINALIYNKEKALELKALFLEDLKDCEPLDVARWENRSTWCKFQESVSRLWAPLL
jgi:cardiolipin synthase